MNLKTKRKMGKINEGDRAEALDDLVSGKVIRVDGDQVTLETQDGFELVFARRELVKISEENQIKVDRETIELAKKEKQIPRKHSSAKIKPKERNLPAMEVDLHIHHLVNSTRNMTNFEMLNLQLETAKRQLDFAIKKRIQKVVFIHGVGEGVLRTELETLFNRYENLKFYDADYQKYGLGATEVYIFQN